MLLALVASSQASISLKEANEVIAEGAPCFGNKKRKASGNLRDETDGTIAGDFLLDIDGGLLDCMAHVVMDVDEILIKGTEPLLGHAQASANHDAVCDVAATHGVQDVAASLLEWSAAAVALADGLVKVVPTALFVRHVEYDIAVAADAVSHLALGDGRNLALEGLEVHGVVKVLGLA